MEDASVTLGIDTATLEEKWRARRSLGGASAVAGERTFVQGRARVVEAAREDTGARSGVARLGGQVVCVAALGSTAVATSFLEGGYELRAFDLPTERALWSAPLSFRGRSLALGPGRVAVFGEGLAAGPLTLEARDLQSGALLWTRDFDGETRVVDADSFTVAVLHRERLVGFDWTSGRDCILARSAGPTAFALDGDRLLVGRVDALELLERGVSRWSVRPCDAF